MNSFSSLCLSQLINIPTHKNGNTLDILLSNSETSVNNLKVLDSHGFCKSDHFPVSFSINTTFSRKKTQKRSVYNFKKANWAQINHELRSVDWTFLGSAHPNNAWKLLRECLLNLSDRYIPKVRIKSELQRFRFQIFRDSDFDIDFDHRFLRKLLSEINFN